MYEERETDNFKSVPVIDTPTFDLVTILFEKITNGSKFSKNNLKVGDCQN